MPRSQCKQNPVASHVLAARLSTQSPVGPHRNWCPQHCHLEDQDSDGRCEEVTLEFLGSFMAGQHSWRKRRRRSTCIGARAARHVCAATCPACVDEAARGHSTLRRSSGRYRGEVVRKGTEGLWDLSRPSSEMVTKGDGLSYSSKSQERWRVT